MIKLRKEYMDFREFMSENYELIYDEQIKLFLENPTGDIFLEMDVQSIGGRTWESKIRYGIEDRITDCEIMITYYLSVEQYDKCVTLNEIIEKNKKSYLELV